MTAESNPDAGLAGSRDRGREHSGTAASPTVRPRRLTVEDVMTREVVTVAPSATFHQMIGLMRRHGVSALPVIGADGELLGVVSEADLLEKETPPAPRHRWVPESGRLAARRLKADGVDAATVMSSPVISIRAGAPLVAAARLIQKHQVKRLVVLDAEERLVGIVSRRDLLAGLDRSDAEIRSDVIDGVIPRWLLADPAGLRVEVQGGIVRLEGVVGRRSDAEVLAHLVRGLDGVVEVDSAVDYRWDDRDPAVSRELPVS